MSRNQTSSRSTKVIVKKIRKEKRKRDCELGSKCPYKDEYQHQLEYDHHGLVQSEKGKTTKSRKKKSRKTVNKNTINYKT